MNDISNDDKKVNDKAEDSLKDDNHEKILELEKKAQEYLDGWKRAKADYINYKKEMEERQNEIIDFAKMAIVVRIIPLADNFNDAFKHIPEDFKKADWVKGIEHIKKQINGILKDAGLERIKTVGEKFNPEFHEAVAHEKKEGFEPDIIFTEVKSGYILNGRTFVAAKVKVAK